MKTSLLRAVVRPGILFAAMVAAGAAQAAAHLDPQLASRLAGAAPTDQIEVVVSYSHSGPATDAEVGALRALGISHALRYRALPIVGALATPSAVNQLAARSGVASVYLNRQLQYFNLESRQISGVERAQNNPGDFGRAVPYSGFGVTAMINDSGIDGTHMDLSYGTHVVANAQGLTNLHAYDDTLPITYIENQPDTDTNSGHGTHCAGILGGTGARSSGKYKGVAPGADLVGYGSGAAIAILDAVGGFDYALVNQNSFAHPIRVISNSWGTSGPFDPLDPVSIASYEAYKHGISVLFAAGNAGPGEDSQNPYAEAPWVISVAAGTKQGGVAGFSSRGARFESGNFTMPDGVSWTYYNQPTITATGLNVISTRAITNVAANGGEADTAIEPRYLPFYTMISGTSMATPHAAGIVTLLYEANPGLTPALVKDILKRTATNIPGREAWETGAGHINAYAALAEAAGLRHDFGRSVNALRAFNANALLQAGDSSSFSIAFSPVGPTGSQTFNVGAQTAWVSARATVPANTVALVLIDPNGVRYGSGITLPELGNVAAVSAPGVAGTWTLTVRGIGSVSGVALDPAHVTNGYALPGTVSGTLSFLDIVGYTGLSDIANHPARGAIEFAVGDHLVDGLSGGAFQPDANLSRGQLAEYLTMGAATRQQLPLLVGPGFPDVATTDPVYPFAEAASRKGGALKDLSGAQNPVVPLVGGQFRPTLGVTRVDEAYALVQSLAQQSVAEAYTGDVKVYYNSQAITLDDSSSIPANRRGYVQVALDLGLMNVRFYLTQGPFDLTPTIHAAFEPARNVTRAEFTVDIGRFETKYGP